MGQSGLLHVRLLGTPAILPGNRSIELPRRQTRALLYRLAAGMETVARTNLCFLFWPDVPDTESRRNFTRLVYHLRSALPSPDMLLVSDTSVSLNPQLVFSDSVQFVQLCATQRTPEHLRQAVELYRGEFLDGFSLGDNIEFEAWSEQMRASFERFYLHALFELIEIGIQSGAYRPAIDYAQKYLAHEPLTEEIHCRLIELYLAVGERGAALRQSELVKHLFQTELGVAPSDETNRLIESVRSGKAIFRADNSAAVSHAAPHLPAPASQLIGRTGEIEAAQTLLLQDSTRLMTLTGPGGVGKTQLGLSIAAGMQPHFAHGIYFVNLAPLQDVSQVAGAIARTLGIWQVKDVSVLERLQNYLLDKQILLLLDNFEHVLAASTEIATLLSSCHRLKVLATSRSPLHIYGEHTLPVRPLALPDMNTAQLPEMIGESEAVTLLVERARMVKPGFRLTKENAPAAAQLCIRLDGLPLAIELAASWIKLFSLPELLQRLSEAQQSVSLLQWLQNDVQDVTPRHRSLWNTIAWSYQLLRPQEQHLFEQLAVFSGGFSLNAVEALNQFDTANHASGSTLPTMIIMASLLDKSLVQQTPGTLRQHESRFTLLESIRQFGLERLHERGSLSAVRHAHALYYMKLAEAAEPALMGAEQAIWLDTIELEHDNLQTALRWSMEGNDVQIGLRLGGAIWRFWYVRGHFQKGHDLLITLLALPEAAAPTLGRARALFCAGLMAYMQTRLEASVIYFEESITIFRQFSEPLYTARALSYLGRTLARHRDEPRAIRILDESITIFRSRNYEQELPASLNTLASIARRNGDYPRAQALLEESLALSRQYSDYRARAGILFYIGGLAILRGRLVEARDWLEECAEVSQSVGSDMGIAWSNTYLGFVALLQGNAEPVNALFQRALSRFERLGEKWSIAALLTGFAALAVAQQQPGLALRLAGAVATARETTRAHSADTEQVLHDHFISKARAMLPADDAEAAWLRGCRMTIDEAVRLVAV